MFHIFTVDGVSLLLVDWIDEDSNVACKDVYLMPYQIDIAHSAVNLYICLRGINLFLKIDSYKPNIMCAEGDARGLVFRLCSTTYVY